MIDGLDADTLAALRRIVRHQPRPLCPGCGRRDLEPDADLCQPCTDDAARARRRDWWNRQGDVAALRAQGLTPRDVARRWLAHQLRRGPVNADVLAAAATTHGISQRTLRRAREDLQGAGRLTIEKAGLPRGTVRWRLNPPPPNGHPDT